jgi:hypothetical protein
MPRLLRAFSPKPVLGASAHSPTNSCKNSRMNSYKTSQTRPLKQDLSNKTCQTRPVKRHLGRSPAGGLLQTCRRQYRHEDRRLPGIVSQAQYMPSNREWLLYLDHATCNLAKSNFAKRPFQDRRPFLRSRSQPVRRRREMQTRPERGIKSRDRFLPPSGHVASHRRNTQALQSRQIASNQLRFTGLTFAGDTSTLHFKHEPEFQAIDMPALSRIGPKPLASHA